MLEWAGLGGLISSLVLVSLVTLCGGSSVLLGAVLLGRLARQREQRWAASLGLKHTARGWVAQIGGTRLRLTLHPEGSAPWRTELRLSVPVPTGDLAVIPRKSQLVSGDRRFDSRFQIAGSPIARAFLNGKVRAGLLGARRSSIEGRRLQMSAWREEESGQSLRELMEDLAALAQELRSVSVDPHKRLLELAGDASPAIRAAALPLATEHDPELGRQLAREALSDTDPLVRCAAAVVLRDANTLAACAREGKLPVEQRAQAVHLLQELGPLPCFPEVAVSLLAHKSLQKLARPLLVASGPEGVRVLIDLADTLDPRAPELPSLIEAMRSLGSVRAVPALRRLEDRLPTSQKELRKAIWTAVAHLQGSRTAEAVMEAGA